MADDTGKTEKPTPKRLRDARRDGQFPRTPDAAIWASLAAATVVMPLAARWTEDAFRRMFARIPDVAADPGPARAFQMLAEVPGAVLRGAGLVCGAAALAALLATAAQGVHPSSKALKPKFNRMSPLQGVKRMFGPRAAWEGLKALLKVAVIGAVITVVGWDFVPELAGADYAYQRRTVMKQLRMSMFEIKQEHKQSEGDPQVKAAIRQKQLQMSRNRMLANIATADVVVVNPTHLAVALKYQPGAGAPRVVAKGAGAIALKIRERAREHRVPVIEDKPLCRVIYRVCELDEEIPAELYAAVARILAFVMSAGRPSANAGVRRPSMTGPTGPVPELPTRAELRARRAREVRAARERR